jgi:UDP-3-O-[3-hydroxymyristoyl] glucosamine N-acyltransferase
MKRGMDQKEITLATLANMVEGVVVGDLETPVTNLADLESAGPGDITFLAQKQHIGKLSSGKASACIVPHDLEGFDIPAIKVENPILAATIIHNFFLKKPYRAGGIHHSAHIGSGCQVPADITIGPMVVLGDHVTLGERVILESGVVLGDGVTVGSDSKICANVTVQKNCLIGSRVIIASGTVVGSDGFGYVPDAQGNHIKRPHVGNVEIEDDVEIGANVCIDRATFGSTLIRKGTKIDNLVQVAHNVEIGEKSLIISQTGIAGSAKLGNGVIISGQVAIKDHVELGDGVIAAGKSGITSSHKAGSVISGFPAMPHKEWLRATIAYPHLPQVIKDIRKLMKKIDLMEGKMNTEKENRND